MRAPVVLHPNIYLLLSVFFLLAILVGIQWYLYGFNLYLLMTNDVENLFMCLLLICISSVKMTESFTHFYIR